MLCGALGQVSEVALWGSVRGRPAGVIWTVGRKQESSTGCTGLCSQSCTPSGELDCSRACVEGSHIRTKRGDPTGPSLGDDPARGPGRRPRRATDRPRLPRRSKAARETVAGVPTGSSEHPASNWAAGTRPIRSSRRSGRCWSLFGADEELREYRRQRRQKSWLANWCKVLAACAS